MRRVGASGILRPSLRRVVDRVVDPRDRSGANELRDRRNLVLRWEGGGRHGNGGQLRQSKGRSEQSVHGRSPPCGPREIEESREFARRLAVDRREPERFVAFGDRLCAVKPFGHS
jgi:hypothetical protein